MARREGEEAVALGSVVSRARRLDAAPTAALRAFGGPRVFWAAPEGPTVAGCGAVEAVTAGGPDRFEAVREGAAALLAGADVETPAAARPRLLGGFSFHEDHEPAPPWRGFPGGEFLLPRVQVVRVDGETWLTVTAAGEEAAPGAVEDHLDAAAAEIGSATARRAPPPGITGTERTPDRAEWRRQVRAALRRIEDGTLQKVVLAQSLRADLRDPFRLVDALERLGETYAGSYRFGVDPGVGAAFFGATPERLVERRGDRVATEALAGSTARGGTAAEDDRLARELVDSPKARREHRVVAEAIRDQLAPLSTAVRTGERGVKKFPNVQHLHTPVEADLAEPRHVLDIAAALHPTPAVGGLPPAAASETIRAAEAFDRGWYAAPVGWFDADGDGAFAVGIRSAVATDDAATLFAGNGIVADSDPDDEWDELQLKYRPILDHLR